MQLQLRRLFVVMQRSIRLNEKRAKVRVNSVHVNFNGGSWPWSCVQRNGVTSLQIEHPTCIQGTLAVSWFHQRLGHGNDFVVHANMNSSIVEVVNLSVDVVTSGDGHS